MNVFKFQMSDDENTHSAEYRVPCRPRSSRSILWKDHLISYNVKAATMAETFQNGLFLMFEGHMAKAEKRPNTKP